MYKVFVNEKSLSISQNIQDAEKQLRYEGEQTLDMALDFLENTSVKSVHVYGDDEQQIWRNFQSLTKIIEAAGGIVKNSDDKILFIHRLGRWDLPKGKLEKREKIEEAALREIEEETGISDVKLDEFATTTFHIYREKSGLPVLKTTHWYKMTYDGNAAGKPQREEGITAVEWKSADEIKEQVLPSTFRNIELIITEFVKL